MTERKGGFHYLISILAVFMTVAVIAAMSVSYCFAIDMGDDPTVGDDNGGTEEPAEPTEPEEPTDPGLVEASGLRDNSDIHSFEAAMAASNVITFESGKTYYLKWPMHMVSGKTINATGATIICEKNALDQTTFKKGGYENIKNVTINGGTWKYKSTSGFDKTTFSFVHGQNIKMKNMTIQHASYDGHAVEIVACKNVVMDNVKIIPLGTKRKSEESMVQIDIATLATYPRLSENKSLANGATCKNVTIQNCTISGNRAISSGYSYKEKKYVNKYHTDITIKNCTLTSWNAEGVFLANAKNATITGNTIISKCKKKNQNKSTGLHLLSVGKIKKATFVVKNNTIKGGRFAIRAWSDSKVKIAKVTMRNNKFYCKKGKKNAIGVNKKGVKKIVSSKNKKYKW